jgi:hypothetical protein
MATIPEWRVAGDWFDVCKCTILCPCTFAQLPTTGDCEGVLAYPRGPLRRGPARGAQPGGSERVHRQHLGR